jgi:hypothetical protein
MKTAATLLLLLMAGLAIVAYEWRGQEVPAQAGPSVSKAMHAAGPASVLHEGVTARPDAPEARPTPPAAKPLKGRVRTAQWNSKPLPPGAVRDYLPGLLAAANAPGATAEANWRAFEVLNACRFLAELRAELQDMQEGSDALNARIGSNAPDCVGVPEQEMAGSMRYLKRAAELGDDRAIFQYASGVPLNYMDRQELIAHPEVILQWREDSRRMLLTASESGSTDAMLALSNAYEYGRLGVKDPVLAYQYMLAWRQLAMRSESAEADAMPNRLGAHLAPQEVARGQQGAAELIARCCRAR